MKERLLSQKLFGRLHVVWVGQTAIHRADSGALRLLVKARAFCTFTGHDIVVFCGEGRMRSIRVYDDAIGQGNGRSEIGPIPIAPLNAPLVNSIIRTFGLARAAVDTIIGDANSHIWQRNKKTGLLGVFVTDVGGVGPEFLGDSFGGGGGGDTAKGGFLIAGVHRRAYFSHGDYDLIHRNHGCVSS